MIRVERDPAFWLPVASHPDVLPTLYGASPEALERILGLDYVLPLAATHGGFLFTYLDAFKHVAALHTMFRPEGWGREVLTAAKEACELVFGSGAQIITTYEMRDNPRSQPPRSFGFAVAADFAPSDIGEARSWFLSKAAWEASPAHKSARRLTCPHSQQ